MKDKINQVHAYNGKRNHILKEWLSIDTCTTLWGKKLVTLFPGQRGVCLFALCKKCENELHKQQNKALSACNNI